MTSEELLRLITEAHDDLVAYLNSAFVFQENVRCPFYLCKRMTASQLQFFPPRIDWRPLNPETGLKTISVTRVFPRLLDGYCTSCGYNIYAMHARIDPELKIDQDLANEVPEVYENELCHECGEAGVLGFFRRGACTNGICIKCGLLIVHPLLHGGDRVQLSMRNIAGWIRKLQFYIQALKGITPQPFDAEITIKDRKDS